MSDVKWIKSGSRFNQVEGTIETVPQVPVGIYEVDLTLTGWYLRKTGDKFTFPYKLYDLQNDFLSHLKKTYDNTTGNLGVLFNGTRGTGKSVSAKIFANELNLPIIIVKSMGEHNDDMFSYLAGFNFDCIFFFDEFEKQFDDCDSCILGFMDGIYNSDYRRVFLLTTNKLSVNENLLSRPSRIRYIREFGNLEEHTVREYLADNLKDVDATEELVGYIDSLAISTIDILKTIVEEVNIHGIDKFLEIKKFFNVELASFKYNTIRANIDKEDIEEDGQYTIEDFLREKDTWTNRYALKNQLDETLESISDQKKRAKLLADFHKQTERRASFDYDYYEVDKPWHKYLPGKDYWNGEKVIKIDVEHRVIVTEYMSRLFFYYIKNENRPSLYGGADYGYLL